jgi:hypothetical protein
MTTTHDKRRLADGAHAAGLAAPKTAKEIQQQLSILEDGILAMQSLDDLGSAEDNQRAWDDMLALQQRYKALKKVLKAMSK